MARAVVNGHILSSMASAIRVGLQLAQLKTEQGPLFNGLTLT